MLFYRPPADTLFISAPLSFPPLFPFPPFFHSREGGNLPTTNSTLRRLRGGVKIRASEFLGGGETPNIIANSPPPATALRSHPPPQAAGGKKYIPFPLSFPHSRPLSSSPPLSPFPLPLSHSRPLSSIPAPFSIPAKAGISLQLIPPSAACGGGVKNSIRFPFPNFSSFPPLSPFPPPFPIPAIPAKAGISLQLIPPSAACGGGGKKHIPFPLSFPHSRPLSFIPAPLSPFPSLFPFPPLSPFPFHSRESGNLPNL